MFPLEKYRYFTNGEDTVIAEQTFAGRKFRGKAICDSQDEFDLEKGKKLAALRCNLKICEKRLKLAKKDYENVKKYTEAFMESLEEQEQYLLVASEEYIEALKAFKKTYEELR